MNNIQKWLGRTMFYLAFAVTMFCVVAAPDAVERAVEGNVTSLFLALGIGALSSTLMSIFKNC